MEKPKLVPIAPLPQVLHNQRDKLRKMMAARCALPDSPIPPKLANRVADWILMLVSYRANERRKAGKPTWENAEVLQEDIARSGPAPGSAHCPHRDERRMRIPLAPPPIFSRDAQVPREKEAAESWRTWVASKCPREKPEIPEKRPPQAPFGHFAGHSIPKRYTPPFDQ